MNPWSISWALGARGLVWVGDEADLTRYDPVAAENVQVIPAALELEYQPADWFARVRVEEGLIHAGGLEAAEASVGWARPWAEVALGRDDLPVSADREVETEELGFFFRPVLSRSVLPLHTTGVRASFAWPTRASLTTGLSWPTPTADAPYRWARASIGPLVGLRLGGALLSLDSAATGRFTWIAADGAWSLGPVTVAGGWNQAVDTQKRWQWQAELRGELFPERAQGGVIGARVEQVFGLEEQEDSRWLLTSRAGVRLRPEGVLLYVEAQHAAEVGTLPVTPGVVVVEDGVARANDVVAVGLMIIQE